MKLFDVTVVMVTKKKHWLRLKARSADEAMSQTIIKMEPFEVLEMRTKEIEEPEEDGSGYDWQYPVAY